MAPVSFEVWKLQLRKECELQGRLLAFDNMGDYALRLLWENGLDPTIEAIAASIKNPTNES